MQHSHKTQSSNNHSGIVHFIFLLIGILAVAGLYLYFQNTTSVILGIIALVVAHIIAVIMVAMVGRGLFRKLGQHIHGTPSDQHTHTHSHNELETEGNTISWAWFYDILVKMIMLGKEKQFREAVVDLAHIQPNEKVLEVGCGTGTFAIIAKQRTHPSVEIHATDAAPEMIQRARQEAAKSGVDVHFDTGLAERIDFPDNSFDVVMNTLMVHHLPEHLKAQAFAEMYRVLKLGGRLQIVDFEPPKTGLYKLYVGMLVGDMMQIDNTKIVPLLEEVGFQSIEMGNAGHPLGTYISGVKA